MPDDSQVDRSNNKVVFESKSLTLDLRFVLEGGTESGVNEPPPKVDFGYLDLRHQVKLLVSDDFPLMLTCISIRVT